MGLIIALFALVALLYSSVGFGGGSSYTAILAWQGESPETIRMVSLSCNLVVVMIGSWATLRSKVVKRDLLLPLLASSVPGVFIGARWQITEEVFFNILGVALLVAGSLLVLKTRERGEKKIPLMGLLPLGFFLGALAGITGIGGGIYLVPVLHLLGAGKAREVAAVGTWFILINSAVGLLALPNPIVLGKFSLLPLAVAGGGLLGARLLQGYFSEILIRRWTGVLILIVSGRILLF